MHARLSRIRVGSHRIDLGVELVGSTLAPAFLRAKGSRYGCWMVDRSTGEVFAVTCWADPSDIARWLDATVELRAAIVDATEATIFAAEDVTVHGFGAIAAPAPDEQVFVRAVWADSIPSHDDAAVDAMFEAAMEEHRDAPGFLNAVWLANPQTRTGVGLTTWTSADAIDENEPINRRRRKIVARELGCEIWSVKRYEAVQAVTSESGVIDLRDRSGSPTATPTTA